MATLRKVCMVQRHINENHYGRRGSHDKARSATCCGQPAVIVFSFATKDLAADMNSADGMA